MEEAPLEKLCLYCGAGNSPQRTTCIVCHHPLVSEEERAQSNDELIPIRNPPDISAMQFTFHEENGIYHPDWNTVLKQMIETVPKEDWWQTCHELAKRWLLELKADLGGHYRCYESENFLVFCAEGTRATWTMIEFAEGSLAWLNKQCGVVLPKENLGKRVILVFTDQDDYYAYVSHFYPEGTHSLSAGILVNRGYMHIALPFTWVSSAKAVITHELVHNCIAHLPVPTWLHEGLAQKLEHDIISQGFTLDHELAGRHHEHWSEQNIQQFWSGASFYGPDERNELSYSLAWILVELLAADWNRFLEFVLQADIRDAGQDASVRIMERCLGETIGSFLGPGNWRPQRKAIADHQTK